MRLRLLFTSLLLAVLPASGAVASTITMDLSIHFGTDPSSGPVAATFVDTVAPAGVTLTLDTHGLDLDTEFVSGWYFNFLGETSGLTFTYVSSSSSGPDATTVSLGDDEFMADGDGDYDILLAFPNSGDRFNLDETVVYTITGTGIAAIDFNEFSVMGGGQGEYLSAAKIQGTDLEGTSDGSDWLGAVPEPSTALLLLGGLSGLVVWGRRRLH